MPRTLGKGFVECNTRQRAHGSYSTGKQRLCQVFSVGHSAKTLPRAENDTRQKKSTSRSGNGDGPFAVWQTLGPRQIWPICRVSNYKHSAKLAFLPCVKEGTLGIVTPFVVCQSMGTQQRPFQNPQNLTSLPSVIGQTLGKDVILVPECTEFCHVSTLPSGLHLALGKKALCRV